LVPYQDAANADFGAFEINGLRGKNDRPTSASEGPVVMCRPMIPRRRRTIKNAQAMLDRELNLNATEKRQAMLRIRNARQPKREAERIINHHQSKAASSTLGHNGTLDLSNVRELEVILVRRNHIIEPVQGAMLNRLACNVARGDVSPAKFRAEATVLLAMSPTQSEKSRKAEARRLRE
jgi:hypothetical protein